MVLVLRLGKEPNPTLLLERLPRDQPLLSSLSINVKLKIPPFRKQSLVIEPANFLVSYCLIEGAMQRISKFVVDPVERVCRSTCGTSKLTSDLAESGKYLDMFGLLARPGLLSVWQQLSATGCHCLAFTVCHLVFRKMTGAMRNTTNQRSKPIE